VPLFQDVGVASVHECARAAVPRRAAPPTKVGWFVWKVEFGGVRLFQDVGVALAHECARAAVPRRAAPPLTVGLLAWMWVLVL